jgi:5-methylcytosine-specific restriction endonuclease McrA
LKFCKKCQCETERNKNDRCKTCAKNNSAAWKLANPEKALKAALTWRAANQEKDKAQKRLAAKTAYSANPQKFKDRAKAWKSANPEIIRVFYQHRRAKKSGGVLSRLLAQRLYKLQRGKCACCSLPLGDNYHLDHIMPLALGGSNTDDNIQLLRQRCNGQKHASHPIDFMQSRGFLL